MASASASDLIVGLRCAALLGGLCWLAAGIVAVGQPQPPVPSTLPADLAEVFTDPDGSRYTLKRLRKQDIRYRKLGEDRVRVLPIYHYRLAKEDAEYLYVKEYLPVDPPPKPPADPAASRTGFSTATGSVDRLALRPFDDGLPTQGQWRNRFALADMNGDGKLDIVHGPPRKGGGGPRVFLGDGAGHWRLWNEASFPAATYDYGAVAVADFNGNGPLDLALAAHHKGISVLLGDGQGRFHLAVTPTDLEPDAERRFTSRAILARDWDRDGKPDILALGEGPRPMQGPPGAAGAAYGWAIYLNQGENRWRKLAQSADAPRTFGDALAVGDFDGDGSSDLLTASQVFGNRFVLHYGGPQGRAKTVVVELIRPQSYVNGVAAADFDGDGRDDAAVSYNTVDGSAWRAVIDVLLARDNGRWERRTVAAVETRGGIFAMAAGNLDGDGHKDLVALTAAGETWLFLGRGDGQFDREATPEIAPLGTDCRGYHVELADLDGDGRDEIVAAFAGEDSAAQDQSGCSGGGRLQAWKSVPKNVPDKAGE